MSSMTGIAELTRKILSESIDIIEELESSNSQHKRDIDEYDRKMQEYLAVISDKNKEIDNLREQLKTAITEYKGPLEDVSNA